MIFIKIAFCLSCGALAALVKELNQNPFAPADRMRHQPVFLQLQGKWDSQLMVLNILSFGTVQIDL